MNILKQKVQIKIFKIVTIIIIQIKRIQIIVINLMINFPKNLDIVNFKIHQIQEKNH